MSAVNPQCPLLTAPTVRFNAYALHTDYWYYPSTDDVAEHIISRYRYENPDTFLARARVMQKIRGIKDVMEKGADVPDYCYNFLGLHLSLEYQLEYPCDEQPTVVKKFQLLDGNAATTDAILSRLETEAVLLDAMGFQFFRYILEGEDGRGYSVVEDEIVEGLVTCLCQEKFESILNFHDNV